MTSKSHRIQLLHEHQIEELYNIQKLNKTDQMFYFDLSEAEREVMYDNYQTLKTQTAFVLQLGYFKAFGLFHKDIIFNDYRSEVHFILSCVLTVEPKNLTGKLGYNTKIEQQNRIAQLQGFSFWRNVDQAFTKNQLALLLRTHANPVDALRDLMTYFEQQRIILPSYRNLQDLFSEAINYENKRLDHLVSGIPENISDKLNCIINANDGITDLSAIKSGQKDFKLEQLKLAVAVINSMRTLYEFNHTFLPSLDIANNCILYYAELAEQMPVSRIRMLSKPRRYLYVLCLIQVKYQQCMDNHIISFIYQFRNIEKKANDYANNEESKYNKLAQENYPKVSALLRLIPSNEIALKTPYEKFLKQAYKLLPKNEFEKMADMIEGKAFDKEIPKWDYIEERRRAIASYLRPIILNTPLVHEHKNSPLLQLIDILKNHYKKGKPPSKLKINDTLGLTVQAKTRQYLKPDSKGCYQPARFEFYIYKKLFHAIDRGVISCPDSISYKALKDDLVSDDVLDQVESISAKHGYHKIPVYCTTRLMELEEKLHQAWVVTNENIANGTNQGIQFNDNKTEWQLSYTKDEESEEDVFFKGAEKIEIASLLNFIADKTSLWKQFQHARPHFSKQKSDPQSLLACIMADAFGFGIQKMAEICDLNFTTLNNTHINFIRKSNLKKANDTISNFVLNLPIFRVWDIEPGKVISDYDGSKFKVSRKSIQARYSRKYFGDSPGLSVLSLMANNIPINSKVIGCNEHESHFAFDLVYHNTSSVPVDKLTGDGHTINQMNYVALDVIDTEYIPTIKDIPEQAKSIYCTRDPEQYKGVIEPKGKIDLELIKSQEHEIQRVLLSLILQHNTQSTIVRKLSSHKRNLRLKKALWEYNKIFRSLHILNLINDELLRKNIRRARNRTEAYHQLQRMIRKVHKGMFHGTSTVENSVYSLASRLVANCCIAYNAILLSNVYVELSKKVGDDQAQNIMRHISPIAWQHINFTGRYKFIADDISPDIEVLSKWLESKISQRIEVP